MAKASKTAAADGAVNTVNLDEVKDTTSAASVAENLDTDALEALALGVAPQAEDTDEGGEEEGQEQAGQDDQQDGEEEGQTGDEDGEDDGEEAQASSHQVPKGRLDKEIEKRRKAEQQAAEALQTAQALKQQMDAFLAGQNSNAARQPEQPKADTRKELEERAAQVEQAYNALQARKDKDLEALDKRFDEGEIPNMQAYRKAMKEIEAAYAHNSGLLVNEYQRVQRELTAPSPDRLVEDVNSDPALSIETERLVSANPWFSHLTEKQIATVTRLATQDLENELGRPLQITVQDTWNLRRRLVDVAKDLGFSEIAMEALKREQAATGTTQQGNTARPNTLKGKLDAAKRQPPQTSAIGVGAPQGEVSSKDVRGMEGLHPTEISKRVSEAQLRKLAGID